MSEAKLSGHLFTYLWVGPFESRVILVHLEVDFSGGDGQSPPGHQERGNKLGWAAQDHWACRGAATCTISNNIYIYLYMKQSQTEVHSVKLINVITRCQRPVCTRPTATCQCVLINIWDSNETRPTFLRIMAAQWKSFCNFYRATNTELWCA